MNGVSKSIESIKGTYSIASYPLGIGHIIIPILIQELPPAGICLNTCGSPPITFFSTFLYNFNTSLENSAFASVKLTAASPCSIEPV